MLEENNLNSIETIRKEYVEAQSELEKKHQVIFTGEKKQNIFCDLVILLFVI